MRSFILLCAMVIVGTSLSAQPVSDKLEAYFSFDNCKGIDDSGNGSTAALKGMIACDCGIRDSAMRFVDDNDALHIVGPFADVFTTSDFTVSFYMRTVGASADVNSQVVMSKQDSCNLKNAFWVRYVPKFNRITAGISENNTLFATVAATLDDNPCWQFITITRSNTLFTLWVNGTMRNSSYSTARIDLFNTSALKVGETVCPLDKPFVGIIDELRFHSKALDEDEIAKYNTRADQILNRDTLVYLGNSFQLNTTQYCVDEFTWFPATGLSDEFSPNPIVTPTDSIAYRVEMKYSDGCLAVDSIYIRVIDPATLDCNLVFLPNAFTPGGTPNLNDKFGISNPYAVEEFISFEIFDRWGGRVFNAENAFEAWDGTSGGAPANPGVFLYRLRYKCDGNEKVKAGSLTLLR